MPTQASLEQAAREAWQPIGTAPKDGTWFIAWQNGERYPCQWAVQDRENDIGALYTEEGWFDFFNQSFEEPTQWQPLPEPPAIAAVKEV